MEKNMSFTSFVANMFQADQYLVATPESVKNHVLRSFLLSLAFITIVLIFA